VWLPGIALGRANCLCGVAKFCQIFGQAEKKTPVKLPARFRKKDFIG
jgi:hypothetical protein